MTLEDVKKLKRGDILTVLGRTTGEPIRDIEVTAVVMYRSRPLIHAIFKEEWLRGRRLLYTMDDWPRISLQKE